ncbi:MAG: tryptophan 7-halogenase [Deltaproteobacteria bacterium]|nr:tryptophan 7-halogenase [Deltaproteobacteria bacterium]
MSVRPDVLVIGAGPAGSVAGAKLVQCGRSVVCVDQGYFPRFVIGESLLPRVNELLAQVSMLDAVKAQGYMIKHGALFLRGDRRERFQFADALDGDSPWTWQVPRDHFDRVLATEARKAGVDLRFGHRVEAVAPAAEHVDVTITDLEAERTYELKPRFVVDASGYGRVLPRLFDLERTPLLPSRISAFTHVEGDVRPAGDEEGDIWICVHPRGGWFWIIPFSNGRTSVGIVCDLALWDTAAGSPRERLWTLVAEEPNARERLRDSVPVLPTRVIRNYSRKVSSMHGERWVVTGNAGDFLDPVFSSGVTLALETALAAAGLVDRTLAGERVDWDAEYDHVVDKAVAVFLHMIERWYDGDLHRVFFAPTKLPSAKRQITSLLGGHALRIDNPFVTSPRERIDAILARLPA